MWSFVWVVVAIRELMSFSILELFWENQLWCFKLAWFNHGAPNSCDRPFTLIWNFRWFSKKKYPLSSSYDLSFMCLGHLTWNKYSGFSAKGELFSCWKRITSIVSLPLFIFFATPKTFDVTLYFLFRFYFCISCWKYLKFQLIYFHFSSLRKWNILIESLKWFILFF